MTDLGTSISIAIEISRKAIEGAVETAISELESGAITAEDIDEVRAGVLEARGSFEKLAKSISAAKGRATRKRREAALSASEKEERRKARKACKEAADLYDREFEARSLAIDEAHEAARKARADAGLPPLTADNYNGPPDARYTFDHVDPKSGISHYRLSETELYYERIGRRKRN